MKNIGKKITSSILLLSTLTYTLPILAYTKEESVYSKMDANGNKYKVEVSSHLKNIDKLDTLNDVSELLNIENVSGNNELNKNGNTLTWKANGDDIYYQGDSQKSLPIDINIKYYINDEEISKEDIVGKSGKVKIVYEFINKEKRSVVINGKYETIYVPFVVGLGTIIDNKENKNIEITSGKVIDNGNKSMVFGLSFPGMQESLGLEKNTLNIPNKIEISMEAKDFKMGEIYIYATPKLIEENDFELFDKLDKICNMAGELKNASSKLADGSNALNDGAKELNKGTSSATKGAKLILSNVKTSVKSLTYNNEETLKQEQIELIKANASEQAVAGVKTKISTIDALAEAGVNSKKDTISNSSIQSAKMIAEQTAYATAKEVAGEVATKTAEEASVNTAESVVDSINAGIKAKITKVVIANVADAQGITAEQVKASDTLMAIVNTQVEEQYSANKIDKSTIVGSVKTKFTDSYKEQIKNNAISKIDEKELKEKASQGIDLQKEKISAQAVSSARQIATLTAENTAINVASEVGATVGENVATEVANKVKGTALKEVASSMEKLTDGLNELANGLEKIDNGAEALAEGTTELSEGMNKFDQEGVQKIYNLVNGNVKGIKTRIQKLQELADEYNTFSGLDESANGSVKFIIMIDKLEKEDKKEQAIMTEEVKEEKE